MQYCDGIGDLVQASCVEPSKKSYRRKMCTHFSNMAQGVGISNVRTNVNNMHITLYISVVLTHSVHLLAYYNNGVEGVRRV